MKTLKVLEGWNGNEVKGDPQMSQAFIWLKKHLAAPYKPGSTISVCKWADEAIAAGKFHIADARSHGSKKDDLHHITESLIKKYLEYGEFTAFMEKVPPTLTVLLSPNTQSKSIIDLLDYFRPILTPKKIMLGALDPYNQIRSLKGGIKCPYNSPYIFLTIRYMVKGDSIFLNLNKNYKEIYKQTFGR